MSHQACSGGQPHTHNEAGARCNENRTEEELAEYEERMALGRIVHALREYVNDANWEVGRWIHNYHKLPAHHKALVPHLPNKFERAKECVLENYEFIQCLLSVYDSGNSSVAPHLAIAGDAADEYASKNNVVNPSDVEKVRYVLKNLMRDWSEEGAVERAQSYGKICKELQRVLGPPLDHHTPPSVLVPGAGLARLCCEVAALGYQAQGNEFSYYMLLTSSFILNHTPGPKHYSVYPWIHSNCNTVHDADQLRGVEVPDQHPADLVSGPGLLSMCAGDFVEVYSQESFTRHFDAVATCFFIDTAHNILEYMEVIWKVLKDGGYWINFGPLLYHWADSHLYLPGEELSVELCLEDVIEIAKKVGFKVLRNETVLASYMSNKSSMLQSRYSCAFWTFVKDEKSALQSLRALQLDTATTNAAAPPHATPTNTVKANLP